MPNRMHEILQDKHRPHRAVLEALTVADVEDLQRAALERGGAYRVKAMDMLVAAHAPGAPGVLQDILRAPDEQPDVRAAAAYQLGRVRGPEAQQALIDAIGGIREPAIHIEIARALSMIGSPEAIEPLGRLAENSEGAVREQALFARSVIAYRHRIAGYELPVPDPEQVIRLERRGARRFSFSPAPIREVAVAFASLADETFGVRPMRELAFSIDCGGEHMLLALDEGLLREPLEEVLPTGPALLGIVARREPIEGSYAVNWLVFAWPSEGARINLAVHRPSGRQMFFGSAETVRGGGTFELRALHGPGVYAVAVEGRFTRSSVELTEALTTDTATARRAPAAIEPPA